MSINSEPARSKEQWGAAETLGNVYPETNKWSLHPQSSFQAYPIGSKAERRTFVTLCSLLS